MTMTYAGDVTPDGPWVEWVDGPLTLRKRSVEEFDNNVYLLGCTKTRAALLVDAAARPDLILEMADGWDLVAIVQTHGHWDHIRAWDDLVTAGVEVWGHRGDVEMFGKDPAKLVEHGERIAVGEIEVEVIHTSGHTPGSTQYLAHGEAVPHLITGDSLFPGGPGNTFGDKEKHLELMDNLEGRIFDVLPDETWIHPGHGDDSTLGAERPSLAEWRARGW